ncbi:MAG: hypothetical protein KC877_02000 [Candidatus Kaiserbacteria bacterium]|nr:hypothetical protein [Candidatus Kaiserbacteria bacterium]MCB9816192.1 hypothetical protein [Candidatus Nomurabacteria bacterium]
MQQLIVTLPEGLVPQRITIVDGEGNKYAAEVVQYWSGSFQPEGNKDAPKQYIGNFDTEQAAKDALGSNLQYGRTYRVYKVQSFNPDYKPPQLYANGGRLTTEPPPSVRGT